MKQQLMKAGVLTGPQKIEVVDIPVPPMGPGLIEIKVAACGVCGSDIHMWKAGKGWGTGDMSNFVMGHEYCGVVTNPGDSDFRVGDRVTFWANLYCGKCDMCLDGKEQLCRDVNGTNYIGFVCNGAYAEKFVGKATNAYKLPDTVSDVAAGLIDPLMVAYHAIKQSSLKLNDKVLVVGSGIIGQMLGGLAKKAGASYVAMSKVNDVKISKAREIGDFDEYFDGNDTEREKKMQKASNGGFDVVFEAVGAEEALNACLDGVKPGGEIMLIGCPTQPIQIDINRVVLREVRLNGSVSCTRAEFGETIDLIASGMIDVEKYVTDIMSLEQLQHAFERLTSNTDPVLKMVIKP